MLTKLLDTLLEAFAWLAGALIAFSLLAVSADVFLRYFFNAPLMWAMQATEYAMLYVPMLAAAHVLRREEHVCVDIVVLALSARTQKWLMVGMSMLGCIASASLAYGGWIVTSEQYRRNIPTLDAISVPAYLVTMAIPVGGALLALQFMRRTLAAARGR